MESPGWSFRILLSNPSSSQPGLILGAINASTGHSPSAAHDAVLGVVLEHREEQHSVRAGMGMHQCYAHLIHAQKTSGNSWESGNIS